MSEVRERLSYNTQFFCLVLDAVAWIVFAIIVIYYTYQQTFLAYDNFAIVEGTDNVMQWWFYTATPLAWALIIYRVLQNLWVDYTAFKNKLPFEHQASLLE
jgi:TRAP-type C4-dicarboxylate transport system permease small subunit